MGGRPVPARAFYGPAGSMGALSRGRPFMSSPENVKRDACASPRAPRRAPGCGPHLLSRAIGWRGVGRSAAPGRRSPALEASRGPGRGPRQPGRQAPTWSIRHCRCRTATTRAGLGQKHSPLASPLGEKPSTVRAVIGAAVREQPAPRAARWTSRPSARGSSRRRPRHLAPSPRERHAAVNRPLGLSAPRGPCPTS